MFQFNQGRSSAMAQNINVAGLCSACPHQHKAHTTLPRERGKCKSCKRTCEGDGLAGGHSIAASAAPLLVASAVPRQARWQKPPLPCFLVRLHAISHPRAPSVMFSIRHFCIAVFSRRPISARPLCSCVRLSWPRCLSRAPERAARGAAARCSPPRCRERDLALQPLSQMHGGPRIIANETWSGRSWRWMLRGPELSDKTDRPREYGLHTHWPRNARVGWAGVQAGRRGF
jgi:hypothetical protein